MSKITDKTIKKLKGKSITPSILFFIFSSALGVIAIMLITSAIATFKIQEKHFEKYIIATTIASNISNALENGANIEDIASNIKSEINMPPSLTVLDKDGNLITSYGRELDIERENILSEEIDIDFGAENEFNIQYRNEINVDLMYIAQTFFTTVLPYLDYGHVYENLSKIVYAYDYWICVPVDNTDLYIYTECNQTINANDCLLIYITSAITGVMLAILLGIYLWNAVSNVIAKRYLLKLLLSDNLTGGKNYLAFSSYATKTLTHNKRKEFSIVDLSLMRYQNICSLYGTGEGEKLLMAMETSLNSLLKNKEMFARISDGNYILLLKKDKETNLSDRMVDIIHELPLLLKKPLKRSSSEIKDIESIKFSVGMYIIAPATNKETKERRKKSNIDIDQFHIKAGMAKNALGGEPGIKLYNHDMWEKEIWEQKVENSMNDALKNEEFQVYIQPKYHPATHILSGGEALVRWISPTEGFISPGQFIPIFEKTGFITKLDDYMISHTAALQAKWLEEGKKIVPISINVSRVHFSQPDLAEHIRDLVDQYPLPHEYVEIELTESAFFDDKNSLLSTVRKLQEYGFAVSMDDFGSGYSSLNSLKDLPLNVLKLDAEFFRGEDYDGRGEIVVSEAIQLAKQLNMKIVAEGIEKKEQVDFLAERECDMIQGYYFDKPMPANEYETRMS